MAKRLSTGLVNEMVGTAGKNIRELLNGGFIRIYTGSQPMTADGVETGTLLCTISSTSGSAATDGLNFGTSSGGVLPIGTPEWSGRVVTSGIAGWFRFYDANLTTGTSGTAIRMDGSVAVAGGDMNLTHTDLTVDTSLTITSGTITQPKE